MSQIPPPFDPIYPNYAGPSMAVPERPKAVLVIAIIAIVFGSLGLLCLSATLILAMLKLPNVGGDPFAAVPALRTWNMVTQIIAVGLAIMQLCGGIGALGLYRWARNLLIVWAIASIAITVAQVIGQAILFLPAIDSLQPPAGTPVAAYRMGLHIGLWVGLGFALLMQIWPILVIYYMSKPQVKQAFGIGAPQV